MDYRISHSGVIERLEDGCVKVRIVQTSACASCQVAGHCNASESKVKIVDVFTPHASSYHIGQQVVVSASRSVAGRALLLGFGVPFLLLVGVLVGALSFSLGEGTAALLALGSLVPYYFLLWLCRDSIRQRISFRIDDDPPQRPPYADD